LRPGNKIDLTPKNYTNLNEMIGYNDDIMASDKRQKDMVREIQNIIHANVQTLNQALRSQPQPGLVLQMSLSHKFRDELSIQIQPVLSVDNNDAHETSERQYGPMRAIVQLLRINATIVHVGASHGIKTTLASG
jgi:hypothetical protein